LPKLLPPMLQPTAGLRQLACEKVNDFSPKYHLLPSKQLARSSKQLACFQASSWLGLPSSWLGLPSSWLGLPSSWLRSSKLTVCLLWLNVEQVVALPNRFGRDHLVHAPHGTAKLCRCPPSIAVRSGHSYGNGHQRHCHCGRGSKPAAHASFPHLINVY
jgi:hypothetical protein